MGLAEAQARFAEAVIDPGAAIPDGVLGGGSRFAIHRANALGGLVDVLAGRFPVTGRLVGPDFFHALAQAFVAVHPPRSPVLLAWGDDLPGFIAGFAPAASVPYLADVAELEALRSQAYHAAESTPLDLPAVLATPPDRLASSRLVLHPSVRVVRSRFPVLSIWTAHQDGRLGEIESWNAEDVLVSRPRAEVRHHRLARGSATFLRGLAAGHTIEAAGLAALRDHPGFDVGGALASLVAAEALSSIIPPEPRDET